MTDLLARSVTRDNEQDARAGGVFYLSAFAAPWGGDGFLLPPRPPRYWSFGRDDVLAATLHAEDMWAAAVGKAISKVAARGWTITDDSDSQQRIKRSQEQFLYADGGQGWVPFVSKHLLDYLLADNGAAIETVRASGAAGSRVLGFVHLDSRRTRRTGDPDIPAIYTDMLGREHMLRAHQVSFITDMPSARASLYGVGFCAASRAYSTIYKLAAITTYFSEKITGRGANAVHFIGGVTPQQLEDAFVTSEAEKTRRGIQAYKGQVFIANIKGGVEIGSVDLAGIADGFDAKQERDNGYIIYANALGVPVQDIQPLQGQGLGSGTQSVILDEAAEGQGLAAWVKQFEHWANMQQTPTATTFAFNSNDLRDKKALAEVQKLRAETRTAMIADGTISAEQARQLAVDSEDLPPEFIAQDQTAGGQLADNQKPLDRTGLIPLPPPPTPAPMPVAEKAARYPEILERLIRRLTEQIDDETTALELGQITPDGWQSQLKTLIERYTGAAWKAGQGGAALERPDIAKIKGLVQAQAAYLDKFTIEIKDGSRWENGWNSRAAMYAESIKAPYWAAKTKMLPLPAMPTEGSQCLTRCKCMWDVEMVDAEAGDYNAYWRLGSGESCQTCAERAAQWSPLQVRGGELL